ATACTYQHLKIGKQIGTSKSARGFRLWDAHKGVELPRLDEELFGEIYDIAFSPDGKWLITASTHFVRAWNLSTGKMEKEIRMPERERARTRVGFSPDGRLVVAKRVTEDRLQQDAFLWDFATGNLLKSWEDRVPAKDDMGENRPIGPEVQVSLAISPD